VVERAAEQSEPSDKLKGARVVKNEGKHIVPKLKIKIYTAPTLEWGNIFLHIDWCSHYTQEGNRFCGHKGALWRARLGRLLCPSIIIKGRGVIASAHVKKLTRGKNSRSCLCLQQRGC
jgi:hypothetical protein